MELLDRYLYAVGKYLPKERRDDILAELRTNILAMAEDREQELGRRLNLEEEEAVLKQHGHPMLVAARYMPRQYLIGPKVFPFYWYIMKTAFPWVLLVYLLAHAVRFFFQPVTVQAIVEIVLQFIPVAFYTAGWMTLVFAIMEYATENYVKDSKVLYSWTPRKLQKPERESAPERKTNPIFDFVGSLFGLAFLIVLRQHPIWVMGPAALYPHVFRPAPIWVTVYTLAIGFVSIQLVLKFIAIFSPRVRGWRVAVDLTTKASAIAIIGYLVAHGREYMVLGADADPAKFKQAVDGINLAMYIGWRVVIVILVLQFLWEIGQLIFPRWHAHLKPSGFVV